MNPNKEALKIAIEMSEKEVDCTKLELITYDLWADGNGGLMVNQSFHSGQFICIPKDIPPDNILIGLLKHHGIIQKHLHTSNFNVSGEAEFSLYFDYCGDPSFELRKSE